MSKHKIIMSIYLVLLLVFTTYIVMDTFVLEKSYQTVAVVTTNATTQIVTAEGTAIEDTSSEDNSSTSVTITTYRQYDSDIYVAEVVLGEDDHVYTALADNTYGSNITETTSTIAESVGASLAINGDFYGVQNAGYVVRNGEILRSTVKSDDQEDLVLYLDGTMEIVKEGDQSAQELVDDGAYNVLSFGPGLVENGEISVDSDDEVSGAKSMTNPRTAIGYIDENHYVFVTVDGRSSASEGVTLSELAEFMQSIGCTQAYNLDGGGSSTMYYMGEVVNNPTTNGRTITEREVSDIVYIN